MYDRSGTFAIRCQLFEDDLGRVGRYIEAACARVPILGTVGVKRVINGPIPYSPDGNPYIGPAHGLANFYHCCCFSFGIAQAGGAGKRGPGAGDLPPAAPDDWIAQPWRTFHLQHWIARYRGTVTGDLHVPFLVILQHQQLYDPDFPRRWRQHVLSWIVEVSGNSGKGAGTDVDGRARAAAEAKGLAVRYLSAAQLGYWLTTDELASLPDTEKLARLLVRSVSQDPAAALWPATASDAPGLVNPAIDSTGAAVAAFRHNDRIARSGPGRTVHDLRGDVLRAHLARYWGVSPDDESALTAAARDRGFHSAAGAAESARLFLLSSVSAVQRA